MYFILLFLVTACSERQRISLDIPFDWQEEDGSWWRTGMDTVGVFRNLETLRAMGKNGDDVIYAASMGLAARSGIAHKQMERGVKQTIIALFRNQPEIVDSLFLKYVTPKVLRADLSGDLQGKLKSLKKTAYRTLSHHFREPRAIKTLGRDIPVPYPDSLLAKDINGVVQVQVYVDESGTPLAITLLKGVHPVIDRIVIRATTEVRWQPAYLLQVGNVDPIKSWTRMKVHIRAPKK